MIVHRNKFLFFFNKTNQTH